MFLFVSSQRWWVKLFIVILTKHTDSPRSSLQENEKQNTRTKATTTSSQNQKQLSTMHSSYASNSHCMQDNFLFQPSITTRDTVLPTIQEGVEFELMDDLDVLLEGSYETPLQKILGEEDLITFLSGKNEEEQEQVEPRVMQTLRIGLRERLETYMEDLDSEIVRIYQETEPIHHHEEIPVAEADKATGRKSTMPSKSARVKKTNNISKKNNDGPPIVWVIEPGYDKNGTLRFKFSTDGGAYLILKDEEAEQSVLTMAESSHNIYFQVYSLKEGPRAVSRIVTSDKISQVIRDIVVEGTQQQPLCGQYETPAAAAHEQMEDDNKDKKRPGDRLVRFVARRRRWKNLVGRQVGISIGDDDAGKKSRGWLVLLPLLLIWKMFTRRSRTF
jgi:hypothetical protein